MARVEVLGDDVTGDVKEITKRTGDLRPLLDALAQGLDGIIQRSFANSRSPRGKEFANLAKSTKDARRKGTNKKARKQMRPMINTEQLRLATFVRTSLDGVSIEFGTGKNALYGLAHLREVTLDFSKKLTRIRNKEREVTGVETHSTTRPARQYLPVDDDANAPSFDGGEAANWYRKMQSAVGSWILNGEVERGR